MLRRCPISLTAILGVSGRRARRCVLRSIRAFARSRRRPGERWRSEQAVAARHRLPSDRHSSLSGFGPAHARLALVSALVACLRRRSSRSSCGGAIAIFIAASAARWAKTGASSPERAATISWFAAGPSPSSAIRSISNALPVPAEHGGGARPLRPAVVAVPLYSRARSFGSANEERLLRAQFGEEHAR